jgi:hypothetical protein
MGARNQRGIAGVFERAFVGSLDAHLGQLSGHFLGPDVAPAACLHEAAQHFGIVRIEAQADDVNGFVGESDLDFGPGEVLDAMGLGRRGRAVLAADFIMVGQRPQLDPIRGGAGSQLFRCERAIGYDGVAVKVGIEDGHASILGVPAFSRFRCPPNPLACNRRMNGAK